MNTLYIDDDTVLNDGETILTDDDGEEVFRVRIVSDRTEENIIIYNVCGEEVCIIKSKLLTPAPKYNIFFGESLYGVVSSRLSLFAPDVRIEGVNGSFTLNGDCGSSSYTLYNNKNVFGKLEKKWFDSGAAFRLSVTNDEDTAFFVAIVVSVDRCLKRRIL